MVNRINHDLISFIHQIPLKLGIARWGGVMFNNFDIIPKNFPIHQNRHPMVCGEGVGGSPLGHRVCIQF